MSGSTRNNYNIVMGSIGFYQPPKGHLLIAEIIIISSKNALIIYFKCSCQFFFLL